MRVSSRRRAGSGRVAVVLLILPVCALCLCGCSSAPKLTADGRKADITFLAKWARDYSPFVGLNEKLKGVPSYEALQPTYLRFAEQATTNDEFYRVVSGYFAVIGASGHAYLYPERMARLAAVGRVLGMNNLGISARQLWAGRYWARLARDLPWRAHPPFHVVLREGAYYTDDEWISKGGVVPRGSRIVTVNGMSCAAYLEYVKARTHLRYDAYPKDWVDKYLLVIDESSTFRGWQASFQLPDGTATNAFVPKLAGLPVPQHEVHTVDAQANCTCLELTDAVAYVRIKTMGDLLNYVFKGPIRKDRERIRRFLASGRYSTLIIDIRNNGGGLTDYAYENLVAPFLREPLIFTRTVGLKARYLKDTPPDVLQSLKKDFARYIVETRQLDPPQGFPKQEWTFFRLTLQVSPSARYSFDGRIYVLANDGCFSAADDFADLIKRTKLGTLVGRSTGGAGLGYMVPPVVRLPNSGMLFRMETDLGLTPNGRWNELFGTEPDVELPTVDPPKSITRDELLKDPWVKYVLNTSAP